MKMYDSVLKRVKILEEKNGIKYADTNGRLYSTTKVLFILIFIYAMVIKSFYFLGALIVPQLELEVVTPAICTALLIAGFVLAVCKVHIIGSVLTAVSSVILTLNFSKVLIDDLTDKLLPKFYWAHLAPLCLLVICAVIMTVIAVRSKIKLKKMYNKVAENIYNTYKINVAGGEVIDEEKWEEFLENFDPNNYNQQFKSNE